MPVDLTASFVVNGAAAGQPLQAQVRSRGNRHALVFRQGSIPRLAHGSTITCITRLSPSSIQLHGSLAAAPGGGAGARAAAAVHATPRTSAVHTGVERRRPQRKWQDSDSDEEAGSRDEESGSSSEEVGGSSRDEEADSSSEEGGG
jgi:hypothetical protein